MTTSMADNHRHQANKSERASLRAGCMHKVKVGCFSAVTVLKARNHRTRRLRPVGKLVNMNKNELGNTDKTTWTYRLPSFLPSRFLPTLQNHHVFQAK